MDIKRKLINWFESNFDSIYVIFYTGNQERLPHLKSELERVGLSYCRNLQFYYDVSTPFDETMYSDIKLSYPRKEVNKLHIKKLAMNHYRIAKISYEMKFDKILILEDDICFLKDLNKLYFLLSNTPKDADIMLYDKMIYNTTLEKYNSLFKDNATYLYYTSIDLYTYAFSSAAFYALSREGMKEIIRNNENALAAADTYTNNVPRLSVSTSALKCVVNINCAILNAPQYFEKHYKPFVDLSLYNVPENTNYRMLHDVD